MKIFLSQPMRGRKEEELLQERNEAEKFIQVNVKKTEFVKMLSKNVASHYTAAECLGLSIFEMSSADLVIFLPYWQEARGCRIEHAVCDAYGIRHCDWQEFVDWVKGGFVPQRGENRNVEN